MNDMQKVAVIVALMGLAYLLATALHALAQIAYRWGADLIEDLFAGPAELGPEGSAALEVQVEASKPLAPVNFIGRQWYAEYDSTLGRSRAAHVELYNLTADIPGHPIHSTVSRKTLEAAGYRVPAPEPFNLQAEASRGLGLPVSRTGFLVELRGPGVGEFSN